jgi:hypothetical protein
MPTDPQFLAQLAQAKSRLDDWRSLPGIESNTDPDKIAEISQSRQRIAADLGKLYQSMVKHSGAKTTELSAISRAIAVMRETTMIDLHLINARANLNRVILEALGEPATYLALVNSTPRATA